jgi:hypothetical protein
MGMLTLLDLHQRLRNRISRNFLRGTVGVLSSLLVVITFSSLLALIQITHSVQSLIGDSMVGLETSVAMRAAVRETQLDLLRLRLSSVRKLPSAEIEAFHKKMDGFLVSYRTGVFEEADEMNAKAIENGLQDYLTTLVPLSDNPKPDIDFILAADQSAKDLVDVVEHAYQFNRARIHASADEAGGSAKQALRIANRLGWSFGIFIVAIVLVYLAYRWLALPEENDA